MKTMSFKLAAIMMVGLAQVVLYPTLPGTSIRDFSKPGVVIEGDRGYQTLPGTTIQDYSKPGFKVENEGRYGSGTYNPDYPRRRY